MKLRFNYTRTACVIKQILHTSRHSLTEFHYQYFYIYLDILNVVYFFFILLSYLLYLLLQWNHLRYEFNFPGRECEIVMSNEPLSSSPLLWLILFFPSLQSSLLRVHYILSLFLSFSYFFSLILQTPTILLFLLLFHYSLSFPSLVAAVHWNQRTSHHYSYVSWSW